MKEKSMSEATTSSKGPNTALLAGGGIALVGLGLAAGMFLRPPTPKPWHRKQPPRPLWRQSLRRHRLPTHLHSLRLNLLPKQPMKPPVRAAPTKAARRHEAERQRAGDGAAQPTRAVWHLWHGR